MIELNLQQLPKQSFSAVLENTLYELAIIECAGIMAANISRAGTVLVSGARIVAGQLILPLDKEGGLGNFMILTDSGDLPWWESFGTTQTLIYASAAELAAVRNG